MWVVGSEDEENSHTNNHAKTKKVKKKKQVTTPPPKPPAKPLSILEQPCLIDNIWGIQLPPHILEHMFNYVIEAQGPLPFLVRFVYSFHGVVFPLLNIRYRELK